MPKRKSTPKQKGGNIKDIASSESSSSAEEEHSASVIDTTRNKGRKKGTSKPIKKSPP